MPVNDRHPKYDTHRPDWDMMRDAFEGERKVKERTTTYLPMPSGFVALGQRGTIMYDAYRTRAKFPDILAPTLSGMIGLIHRVEAQIEGLEDKKPLAPLWEKATKDGLTLEAFHRRITGEILQMGRYSILTDVNKEGDPFFAGYTTETVINWSNSVDRDLFVLDESEKVRDPQNEFTWNDRAQYRVLRLKDGVYTQQVYDQTNPGEIITPEKRGNKGNFDGIPFVVAGPRELTLEIDEPPLIGVARSSLAIYRLDADYKHTLFMSGQDTLFVMGVDEKTLPQTVGSGVVVGLPADGDAKYVGISGAGIGAMRTAIQDEGQNAVSAGARLFDDQKGGVEAAEALRLRKAAQTATLTSIAISSAAALEKALRYAAAFVGQDPNEIIVKPNLKFADTVLSATDAVALMTLWQGGAMAKQTLYENLQRGEIASQERTFDEEQKMMDEEVIDHPIVPVPNPNDPNAVDPNAPAAPDAGLPRNSNQ